MVSKRNEQLNKFIESVKTDLNILVGEIAAGKTAVEICNDMNISRERLNYLINELSGFGYVVNREIDFKANIRYNFGLKEKQIQDPKVFTFKIPDHIKEFKIGVMSDIHYREEKDLFVIKSICDLFQKEGINIVFIAGDLFDGTSSFRTGNFDLKDDLAKFVHLFPQYDNMVFVICCGNHDYDIFEQEYIDLNQYLNVMRHDMICLGFDYGFVGLQNDMILLQHPKKLKDNCDNFELPDSPYLPKTIFRIMGHRHCFNLLAGENPTSVFSSATTDIKVPGGTMPGFLILECKRPHNSIECILLKNFIIYDGNIIYDPVGTSTHYVQNYETNIANQRKREEKKKKQ